MQAENVGTAPVTPLACARLSNLEIERDLLTEP